MNKQPMLDGHKVDCPCGWCAHEARFRQAMQDLAYFMVWVEMEVWSSQIDHEDNYYGRLREMRMAIGKGHFRLEWPK